MKIKEHRTVEPVAEPAKPSPSIKKESYFSHRDTPVVGNTLMNKGAEEKEREFKDKMEKYIWSCVPDKRLY